MPRDPLSDDGPRRSRSDIRIGIRRAFRLATGRGGQLAEQVDEEIALHLELRARQLEQRGMTPEAASEEAARRFGALDTNRRALTRTAAQREQTMRAREWFESLWYDVRQATRSLLRDRSFAAVVIVTLALGIGANASMFGVIDRLLLSGPALVVDVDQLRRIYVTTQEPGKPEQAISSFDYVTYTAFRQQVPALSAVAAYTGGRDATMGRGLDAEQVRVNYVTSTLFPLLGTRPALGRFFTADEELPPEGEAVAVLDYGSWQRRFGGDPGVIGRTVDIGERAFTIIGVAPKGFTGAELQPVEFWLPVSASVPIPDWTTSQNATWLRIVGRLSPEASIAQAATQLDAVYRAAQTVREPAPGTRLALRPLWFDQHGVEASEVRVSRWLVGVSVALLLVACANVANLLLARGMRRRREIAVRLALGVSRRRLVRLLLTEGALLAVAGGAAGLVVAYWGMRLLRLTLLDGIAWSGSPVDGRVLAYTAAATFVTALLVGLLPAIRASDPRLAASLASGSAQSGSHRSRLRWGLTTAQAALSALLLIGAGLFVHSLWSIQRLDIGLQPERVLQLSLDWASTGGGTDEERAAESARRRAVLDGALERVRAIPGVASAAQGLGTPFYASYWGYPKIPGYDSLPSMPGGGPYMMGVSDGYFETVGTRILRGRGITSADVKGAEGVVVVNETMARTLWPGGDAIGQCFVAVNGQKTCSRVVGVAQDTPRFELRDEPAFQYYLSGKQALGGGVLLVRATARPEALAATLRSALLQLDPSLLDVKVELWKDMLAPQLRPWRLGATLFALFGALALIVAAVGLYSVMSYTAASRSREMGVRVALGAQPANVRWLVMRQGLLLGLGGIAVGLLLAIVGGRWVEPLLFGTSPREPLVLGGVSVVLVVVALVASLVPAWRASRVSPSEVLRG